MHYVLLLQMRVLLEDDGFYLNKTLSGIYYFDSKHWHWSSIPMILGLIMLRDVCDIKMWRVWHPSKKVCFFRVSKWTHSYKWLKLSELIQKSTPGWPRVHLESFWCVLVITWRVWHNLTILQVCMTHLGSSWWFYSCIWPTFGSIELVLVLIILVQQYIQPLIN